MADVLEKLFDSSARVKIMRLFLLNPEMVFDAAQIRLKCRISPKLFAKEIARLGAINFIKKGKEKREISFKKRGKALTKKVWASGWILNENFSHRGALQGLLLSGASFKREAIASRFYGVGKVKLLLISGVFVQDEESHVDLLLVGDSLKRNLVTNALKILESEAGKELRYAVFETNDFSYRLGMRDKFVRDIFDRPYEKLIDKMGA